MGYLDGFRVTFNKLFKGTETGRTVTVPVREGLRAEAGEAGADPRPPRAQPLRGRHGEVHRLRALRRRVPGSLHLRARRRQPTRRPGRPGERYGFVYEINYLRCIHCDLCVEACPTEAITESKLFEFSFTNRQDAIYTKAELVVDDDGLPQQLPWEDWSDLDEVAAKTSAWVRATAPSGDADYDGVVAWSGELGFGVKAPEHGQDAAAEAEPDAREGPAADDRVRWHH